MGYRAGQSLSSGSLSVFPYLTGRAQFRDQIELRITWGPKARLPCRPGCVPMGESGESRSGSDPAANEKFPVQRLFFCLLLWGRRLLLWCVLGRGGCHLLGQCWVPLGFPTPKPQHLWAVARCLRCGGIKLGQGPVGGFKVDKTDLEMSCSPV